MNEETCTPRLQQVWLSAALWTMQIASPASPVPLYRTLSAKSPEPESASHGQITWGSRHSLRFQIQLFDDPEQKLFRELNCELPISTVFLIKKSCGAMMK
jgi:hypothetical protein